MSSQPCPGINSCQEMEEVTKLSPPDPPHQLSVPLSPGRTLYFTNYACIYKLKNDSSLSVFTKADQALCRNPGENPSKSWKVHDLPIGSSLPAGTALHMLPPPQPGSHNQTRKAKNAGVPTIGHLTGGVNYH